ncbi:MAG: arginase family protein, partial [Acidobacteriota bacterium]
MRPMISRHPWGGLAVPGLELPHDVVILGLPYEAGACWRGGASAAPRRLREISGSSPAISEDGYVVDPALLRLRDAGDIEPADNGVRPATGAAAPGGPATDAARQAYFARVEQSVVQIFKLAAMVGRDSFLLSIGGDHSVSIP